MDQPATLNGLFPMLANVILWLLIFAGTVATIIIIVSGFRLILSGGEAKTVETAKKSITYAIAGLLLVFFAFMILNIISYVTGVACLGDIAKGNFSFSACQTSSGGGGGTAFNCIANETCETNDAACLATGTGSPDHTHMCSGVCCMHH